MQTLRHLSYIYELCQRHYYFIGKCLVSDFAWILSSREAQKDLFIFSLSISCLYSDLVLEMGTEAGGQVTGPIWLWRVRGQRKWYPIADRSTPLLLCVWDGRSCVFGGWEACREGAGMEFLYLRVRDWLKVEVKQVLATWQEPCSPQSSHPCRSHRQNMEDIEAPSDSVWNFMFLVSHVFQNNQFSFFFFRGIVSMFILKMTETQAGEYLLFIQSEASNYTILFTVSIRSKCHLLLGLHSRPCHCLQPRSFPGCSRHNIQVSLNMELNWLNSLRPSIYVTCWDSLTWPRNYQN